MNNLWCVLTCFIVYFDCILIIKNNNNNLPTYLKLDQGGEEYTIYLYYTIQINNELSSPLTIPLVNWLLEFSFNSNMFIVYSITI